MKMISLQNDTHSMKQSVSFVASRNPIRDRSFLSTEAKDMCQGSPLYWVEPRFENTVEGQHLCIIGTMKNIQTWDLKLS